MLGHHAFEATLEARLEKLNSVLFYVIGHEDVSAGLDRLLQAGAPAGHWLLEQRLLFQVERVEREVGDGDLLAQGGSAREALAQPVIVGPSVAIGGDHLAVDDAPWRHSGRSGRDLGNDRGQVVEASIVNVDVAMRIPEEEASQAVPLDLEDVVDGAERRLRRCGLHGPHLAWEALELHLQLVGGSVSHANEIRPERPRPSLRRLYDAPASLPPAVLPCRAWTGSSWPPRPTHAALPSGP